MAEVAAGAGAALAAEEVISTSVQAGVAGYMIAKPTMPLKASYNRVAVADDEELKRRSLERSHHSVTVLGNHAYIIGGTTNGNTLASNDMHAVTLTPSTEPDMEYRLIPALPGVEGGKVPKARTRHAACKFKDCVAVYGGCDKSGNPIDERSSIWLFDPQSRTWGELAPAAASATTEFQPGPLQDPKLFAHDATTLILYGGQTPATVASSDLWKFDTKSRTWSPLPTPPAAAEPSNAAVANGRFYFISSDDSMSSQLHILPLSSASRGSKEEEQKWTTLTFPTNPLAPGPRARHGGALLPITTGYGRNYLVYFLGARSQPTSSSATTRLGMTGDEKFTIGEAEEAQSPPSEPRAQHEEHEEKDVTQWSDMWTLQLPSSDLEAKPKLSIKEAIKPAKIKDAIRSGLGAETGKWGWAEVEMTVPEELGAAEGKLHPGPRAWFGSDVMEDGKSVVFWGGENAEGEKVGDGWTVRLE